LKGSVKRGCVSQYGKRMQVNRGKYSRYSRAYDRSSSEAIATAADSHGVESVHYLQMDILSAESRNITTTLLRETLQQSPTSKGPEKATVTSAVGPGGGG
jgi:hypothetical protein